MELNHVRTSHFDCNLFHRPVALTIIYQRRQDVLYGPYITDVSWPTALPDDRVEASSS